MTDRDLDRDLDQDQRQMPLYLKHTERKKTHRDNLRVLKQNKVQKVVYPMVNLNQLTSECKIDRGSFVLVTQASQPAEPSTQPTQSDPKYTELIAWLQCFHDDLITPDFLSGYYLVKTFCQNLSNYSLVFGAPLSFQYAISTITSNKIDYQQEPRDLNAVRRIKNDLQTVSLDLYYADLSSYTAFIPLTELCSVVIFKIGTNTELIALLTTCYQVNVFFAPWSGETFVICQNQSRKLPADQQAKYLKCLTSGVEQMLNVDFKLPEIPERTDDPHEIIELWLDKILDKRAYK